MRPIPSFARLLSILSVFAGLLVCAGCGRGKVRTRASIEALAADPARDAWQKPDDLLAAAHVQAGQQVVDLGAADGYLVPHLSRVVGPEGVVVAVEFEADLVEKLRARLAGSKLANVRVHQVEEGALPGSGLYDSVVLLDSYGALAEPVGTLERMRARVKYGGTLVVVGHRPDEAVPGPPLEERLDAETVTAEARGAGWGEPIEQKELARQWMLIFRHDPAEGAAEGGEE